MCDIAKVYVGGVGMGGGHILGSATACISLIIITSDKAQSPIVLGQWN